MDEPSSLKQQLPFPYDQDLSHVLLRLNRRTAFSRSRLANDPVTAGYLAAALRLVKRHLGPGAKRAADDEDAVTRPLLAFISQRVVAAEVANNPDPLPKVGSVPTMRSTWKSHGDFIADLMHFGLLYLYPAGYTEEVAAGAERLIDGPDPVRALHDLAYQNATMLVNQSTFRLRLVAAAAAEGDDTIRQAFAGTYAKTRATWQEVYAEFFRARGLQLRAGITLEEFAAILTAVGEGSTMRMLADADADFIDHGRRRSLLGTAGVALVVGCLERVGESDGRTIEEVAHAMIFDRPREPDPAD